MDFPAAALSLQQHSECRILVGRNAANGIHDDAESCPHAEFLVPFVASDRAGGSYSAINSRPGELLRLEYRSLRQRAHSLRPGCGLLGRTDWRYWANVVP